MSVQQEKFKAIADKIRDKIGSTDKIIPNEFVDKIDDVYESGKNDVLGSIDSMNRFFATGQNMGLLTYVLNKDWGSSDPINMQYTFQENTTIKEFIAPKNLRTGAPHGMFYGCINLKTVSGLDEMIKSSVLTDLLRDCSSLTDAGTINFEGVGYANRTFQGCSALVDIQIAGTIALSVDFMDCKSLSKASITSIVNALSTTTSGLTVTFSTQAVNNAFGIDVNNPSTYPEGSEFYVLRNSRSNWTFNYA